MTRIHVNQHRIRSNAKGTTHLPVLTCKEGRTNTYTNNVEILDHSGQPIARVIYRPDQPLSCGARVWIETKQPLRFTPATT